MCSAWASRLISGNHAYATAAHAGLASYPGPSQKAGEGPVRTVCACASLVWSRLQVLKRRAQNLRNRRRGCVHLRSKSCCACIFVPLWSLRFSLVLANNRAVSLFSRGSLQQNLSSRFVVAAFNRTYLPDLLWQPSTEPIFQICCGSLQQNLSSRFVVAAFNSE